LNSIISIEKCIKGCIVISDNNLKILLFIRLKGVTDKREYNIDGCKDGSRIETGSAPYFSGIE